MIYFVRPMGGDYIDYPKKENKFTLTILTTRCVINWIDKNLKSVDIYLKYDSEGKIYFNSMKARDFFAEYLEKEFFMTFCSYEGRNTECYFCRQKSVLRLSHSKLKKHIFLCPICESRLQDILK